MEANKNTMDNNIVISSRIRLARNIEQNKLAAKISQEEAYNVIDEVKRVIEKSDVTSKMGFNLAYLSNLSDLELNALIERHIISPQLVKNKSKAAFMLSSDKKIALMLNEEDHIRLQVLNDGLNLEDCLTKANEIDDILEESLDYAFDKDLGYITSCPTNIGTGMRASVMLHLPALAMTNQLEKILMAISQIGVAVRGVYGEGTKSLGNIYQISNQGTLGAQEETLVSRIRQITMQLVEKESTTRNQLLENNKIYLEDEIFRAYGALKNARIIHIQEAMRLLSMIKFGIEVGILDNITNNCIDELIVKIQPSNMQIMLNESFNKQEGSVKRAEIIRAEMP